MGVPDTVETAEKGVLTMNKYTPGPGASFTTLTEAGPQ